MSTFYTVTPKSQTHRRIFDDLKARLSSENMGAVAASLRPYGLDNWGKATAYAAYVTHLCDALESALQDGRMSAEIEIGSMYTKSGHPEFLRLDADECKITTVEGY